MPTLIAALNRLLPGLARKASGDDDINPSSIAPDDARCPECGVLVMMPAKGVRPCPICGQTLMLRTIPPDGCAVVVTEAQAVELDKSWRRLREEMKVRRALELCGVDCQEQGDTEATLERRLNRKPQPNEVFWCSSHERLRQAARAGDFTIMRTIYLLQARQLFAEKRNPFTFLRHAEQCQLWHYRTSEGVKTVRIMTCANPPMACRRFASKKFAVEKALELMPIPLPGCTRGLEGDDLDQSTEMDRCYFVPSFSIVS